jgi:hypothetical protein
MKVFDGGMGERSSVAAVCEQASDRASSEGPPADEGLMVRR